MTVAAPTRAVHVEHCMGTVFTIDIRDAGPWDRAIDAVVAWLHRVDATFSTYRGDSDMCRIQRGELRVEDADPSVGEVLDLCAGAQLRTNGYFTSMVCGRLDPTGLVKGWAIERASQLLRDLGSSHHAVNGGGDMQLTGSSGASQPWRIGVADPLDPARVLTVVSGGDMAVATSGVAERGEHIVDPFTGRPPRGLASVTVVGSSLIDADAYATAAFAMGRDSVRWLASVDGYEGFVVAADGTRTETSGWSSLTG